MLDGETTADLVYRGAAADSRPTEMIYGVKVFFFFNRELINICSLQVPSFN